MNLMYAATRAGKQMECDKENASSASLPGKAKLDRDVGKWGQMKG